MQFNHELIFFSIWIYVIAFVGSVNRFQMPGWIQEHFASSWCNTFLFGYIFCQIHLSMADIHSFIQPYLQKNFHSQTKMASENKKWREDPSAPAVWELFPLLTMSCPQLCIHWAPGTLLLLLFLVSCPFIRKRWEGGSSGRTERWGSQRHTGARCRCSEYTTSRISPGPRLLVLYNF